MQLVINSHTRTTNLYVAYAVMLNTAEMAVLGVKLMAVLFLVLTALISESIKLMNIL